MGRRRKRLSDQPFELEILSVDSSGMGVAVHEEKNLRVYDTLPGEKIRARYLFGKNQRGKAETLEVLRPSADRVQPRCPHFGTCGACSLQHMSMAAQLARKESDLLQCLKNIGRVEPGSVFEPLDGQQWDYRRKARLSVRDVTAKDRVLVGFRERNGRYVADMRTCHVLRQEIADALPQLCLLIAGLDCHDQIPQIESACGDKGCALIFRHLEELSTSDVARLTAFASATGLGVFLQPSGPDSIQPLAAAGVRLEYTIDALELQLRFEPLDFIQINGSLNQLMVMRALELLEPRAGDNILDLFCGLGNFTLPLATRAGHVTGVEGSADMVERGRSNAALNNIENAEFHKVDLYQSQAQPRSQPPWPGSGYNKIMLDPPRSGALDLLPWIARAGVDRVLYISCNPETLARDAGLLVHEHGFELNGAGVLNMFPHTPHNEAIALFERRAGL